MDRRSLDATVARNVRSVILTTKSTLPRVAAATDVPLSSLVNHPASRELTCDDIAAIGGFLSVPASRLLRGAA